VCAPSSAEVQVFAEAIRARKAERAVANAAMSVGSVSESSAVRTGFIGREGPARAGGGGAMKRRRVKTERHKRGLRAVVRAGHGADGRHRRGERQGCCRVKVFNS